MAKILTNYKLGQFFTTNFKYILQNLHIPQEIHYIIEPFAGDVELLNFIENKNNIMILTQNLWFLSTNQNKSKDKFVFNKYNTNDLYKCFIQSIINSTCNDGILIIPLNFFSLIRKPDIDLKILL